MEVLASIQSRVTNSPSLDPTERQPIRSSMGLREMMRRTSAAARAVSAGIAEGGEAGGIRIPTLTWPPDPAPLDSLRLGGEDPSSYLSSSPPSTLPNSMP